MKRNKNEKRKIFYSYESNTIDHCTKLVNSLLKLYQVQQNLTRQMYFNAS